IMKSFLLTAIFFFSLILVASAQKRWNVYVFFAEECPVSVYMAKPLSTIATKYADDVSFHAVFPLKNSSYTTAQLFKKDYQLNSFDILLDHEQKLASKLGASITPEAIITDETGQVVYRGRINSAFYAPGKMKHSAIKNDLDNALSTLVDGNAISQPWPMAIGCYITMNANP
ncbi:MAG: hypothetical protein ABIQ02_07155, partial [Saprospiraceae bacterium]